MNPVITSIENHHATPLISVMIPAYEPDNFLLKTLSSVLHQRGDFPEGAMQIVLLDDASPIVDVHALVASVPNINRVDIQRNTTNLGLAGNWNRAIELARGEFVHILHQDDAVLPGFYKTLCTALQKHPETGMAYCRHAIIGADDEVQRISHRERWRSGLLRNWLPRIAMRTRIQCPAAIVRRSTYEALGKFRTDLKYSLDWEMWVRIAVKFPVWYETKMLALYRRHAQNESARLAASGSQEPDLMKTIEVFSAYLPDAKRDALVQSAYEYLARSRLKQCRKLLLAGNHEHASRLLVHVGAAISHLPASWTRWKLHRQWDKLHAISSSTK